MNPRPPRLSLALAALGATLLVALPAVAQERTIKVYGIGAKSGVGRLALEMNGT